MTPTVLLALVLAPFALAAVVVMLQRPLSVALPAYAAALPFGSLVSVGSSRFTTLASVLGLVLVVHAEVELEATVAVAELQLEGEAAVDEGVRRLSVLPIWLRLVMAATGGAIEETLYRGYATERLVWLTGRKWIAAALASLGFALAQRLRPGREELDFVRRRGETIIRMGHRRNLQRRHSPLLP